MNTIDKKTRQTYRVKEEGPRDVDVHVGQRLRLRRTLLGLSQEKLGEAIGVTFQQIQKYERGTNRISASRLWEISRAIQVPVAFFFEGFGEEQPENGAVPLLSNDEMDLLAALRRRPKATRALTAAVRAIREGT